MTREIGSILTNFECIEGVWGFGSFFRSVIYNDIDLLVVVNCERGALLATSRTLRFAFDEMAAEIGVPLDLLVLTSREFQERPLREMNELVPLYVALPWR